MTDHKRTWIAAGARPAAALALLLLAIGGLHAEPAAPATPAAPAAPATAPAAPVFPTGSRIGLAPPAGMTGSKTFPGFVDSERNSGIIINELPPGAYADIQKSFSNDELKKRGVTVEKRETLQLGIGQGDLIVGTQLAPDKTLYRKWLLMVPMADFTALITAQAPVQGSPYSDAVVRAAFATLAVRAKVPEEEFLSLLPFKIGDLAGFHIGNIIPGRAVLLIDAPKNPHMVVTEGLPEYEFDARFIVTAGPGAPSGTDDRANFARTAFNTIQGIKDIQFTMAEPVRINSQEGFETVASAKDVSTGAPLRVIQWLRFGGNAFLQMVGISRADIWNEELTRMRTLRDSIDFK
jgi:hypothetical protein